jgi:hypothetical protein
MCSATRSAAAEIVLSSGWTYRAMTLPAAWPSKASMANSRDAQIAGGRAEGMTQRMRCHARYAGPILRIRKTQQPLRCGAEFATLSDEERIGYNRCFRATTKQKASQCRLGGAAPISIKHPGRLLDLSAPLKHVKKALPNDR